MPKRSVSVLVVAAGVVGLVPEVASATAPTPSRRVLRGDARGMPSRSRATRAVRKVITGFENPYVDYVITAPNRVRTTFAVRGSAQRVATIHIGS